MPTLYMLIGVPASGKSTWLQSQDINGAVVSTDNHIEAAAKAAGKTYNDVFKSVIKKATSQMNADLKVAIENDQNIYWDQTNLNVKSRKGKLSKVPEYYRKVAVVFPRPDMAELDRRLASRPGKVIPSNVMASMLGSFEKPMKDEGFDEIITV